MHDPELAFDLDKIAIEHECAAWVRGLEQAAKGAGLTIDVDTAVLAMVYIGVPSGVDPRSAFLLIAQTRLLENVRAELASDSANQSG